MLEKNPAKSWLRAAQSHLDAARRFRSEHPRSCASRAYYAAFSAAHAVIVHLQPAVAHRPRGHFHHGDTGGELRWTLLHHSIKGVDRFRADFFREQLEDAYNTRVASDYQPMKDVSTDDAADAESAAASIVRLAERIVQ